MQELTVKHQIIEIERSIAIAISRTKSNVLSLRWRLNEGARVVCIHALYQAVISSAGASIGRSLWVLRVFRTSRLVVQKTSG